VQCAARRTGAARAGLLEVEQALHLAELGIDSLELGRLADHHIETEVVAPGHLVDQPAEVPLELGELGRELVASRRQLRRLDGAGALGEGIQPSPAPRPPEIVGDRRHLIT
jgi:hypothetical protein